MKHFLRPGALLLAMILWLSAAVSAAPAAELKRAFLHEGTLYAYVSLTGVEKPLTQAEVKIAAQSFPAASRLETVRQAGCPITYLLLVDNSNSMPPFREEVVSFAQGLAQGGGENTRFLIATFGDAFTVLAEDVGAEELAGEIEKIPFDETVTRLNSSIDSALTYFEALPRRSNELQCLVAITDAVQYDPAGGVPYEELLERVEQSGVMLHSLGFGDDTASLERLGALVEASGGCHQAAGAELAAAEAARILSQLSGDLFVTSFDLSGCTAEGTQTASITFAAGGELVCRVQTELELTGLQQGGESKPEIPPSDTEPAAPSAPEAPSGQGSSPSGDGIAAGERDSAPAGPDALLKDRRVWIAGGAAVLALLLLVAVLLKKRKKGAKAPSPAQAVPQVPPQVLSQAVPPVQEPLPEPPPAADSGIYIRFEALRGEFAAAPPEFALLNGLLIGQEDSCAIRPADASPCHARLFLQDGGVCLEDMGGGTFLNGSPIEGAVRLRSGDEIAVGSSAFRLLF